MNDQIENYYTENEDLIPVVIAGLRTTEDEDGFDRAMDELESLCEACDLRVLDGITQSLPHPDNATWLGSGKAEELRSIAAESQAQLAVCLGNLTPAQMKNLQKIIEVPVWDRTGLILEIFSRRARTLEARLQVESAYLQYMLPRLTGMWKHLGRQSGGGGSRANKGIGEKQIELDRRQISHRITELKKELKQIEKTRDVQRSGRRRDGYPLVALVGYTNAGKSSLMNRLLDMSGETSGRTEDKKVFEKDMLFATLDTYVRRIDIPGRKPFLLSDTVGFIDNIPHDLIKAFRSTLGEVKFADVILIVMDSSDPDHLMHKKVTEDTLRDLEVDGIPRIYVYNKADLRDRPVPAGETRGGDSYYVSARSGYGIEELLDALYGIIASGNRLVEMCIPYTEGRLLDRIHREGEILEERFEEDGTYIKAVCPGHLADMLTSGVS